MIHAVKADFSRISTEVDFNIIEVESNAPLAAGSVELPLEAALLAEQLQAKIKGHEEQLADLGFATFEFDKLPFVIETSGAWCVKSVWHSGNASIRHTGLLWQMAFQLVA